MRSTLVSTALSTKARILLIVLASTCRAFREEKDSLGAVSSESRVCSEIGVGLMKRGGNAADAMVGTALCVGVIGMQHSGIGGGGFMLVRSPEGEYESIDFRETAPAAAFRDMYKHNAIGSVLTGLASGVPGDLRGLEYLHNKYGTLPWRAVCNPAIHAARHGFTVTEDQVRYMEIAMSKFNGTNHFFTEDPQWAMDFAPNGKLVGVGDTMTRKRYANTLETIAEQGANAFYSGEIAIHTIAAIQAQNGTMTLDDLRNFKVTVRPTINITYNGYRIHSTSLPSGGPIALSILKIMEGYDSSSSSTLNNLESIELNTHRFNEAMRYTYAARTELGDPDYFSYMTELEADMLTDKTAEKIRNKILDDRTRNVREYMPTHKHGDGKEEMFFLPENHGTSHIVAIDSSGLSISSTSTVNLLFGSQLVVPETGVIMNNEMNDFSIPGLTNEFGFVPSPINYIAPNKRPLSSISPLIVEHPNGTLYLSIGAAGGSRIPTSTALTTHHILTSSLYIPPLDHHHTTPLDHPHSSSNNQKEKERPTLKQALQHPRIHDQLLPAYTTFEPSYPAEIIKSMKAKGHNVTWAGSHDSAVQGVLREWNGVFEAGSEPRQRDSGGVVV